MLYEEKIIDTIPVGPLGLIPLKSCRAMGEKVDKYLTDWRRERESEHKSTIAFAGYQRDLYYFRQHAEIWIRRGKGRFKRVCPRR